MVKMKLSYSEGVCHTIYFLAVCVTVSVCVDHTNFKTCEQSSFCQRQRQFSPPGGRSQFHVLPNSVAATAGSTGLTANLTDEATGRNLSLRVARMAGGAFRLSLNELGGRPRFEIPPGDALLPGLAEAPVRVSRSAPATGGNGDWVRLEPVDSDGAGAALVLHLSPSPFRLDLLLAGCSRPAVSVNARGLLRWEFLADPSSSSAAAPERFRDHADSMPRGHASVGVDVDFPLASRAYGIPEHADRLPLRATAAGTGGDPYRLYNLDVFEYELDSRMALYGSVPVLYAHGVANATAGVFWHNAAETWVDIGNGSGGGPSDGVATRWMSESGIVDAFLLAGRSPLAVIGQFAALVGTTPLPPLFALGYHQSRWNYNDEADATEVDRKFTEADFPYDALWLDIEHTDGKRCFTWDPVKFPSPQRLVDRLAESGRQLVTIVDPHVKRDDAWPPYQAVRDRGMAVRKPAGAGGSEQFDGWCWPGTSVWPDFFNPDVRDWWSQQFLAYPAAYTWNDMNEPSVFTGPEVTMPKDLLHHGGWEHRDLHNLYGALVHRASWAGQLLKSPSRRPFVLTRALFAGSQRTAATWTGDNAAKWSHLKASQPMLMSLGLAGVALAGADVGGFFGDPEPELLARWYQAGAMQPFFRAHAHLDSKRREPWLFGRPYLDAMRSAVLLRYSLMPYIYTQFYLAEADGRPVMCPLWVHHPADAATLDLDDQHLLGTDLLFKPVTEPGASLVTVYLPQSTSWYLYESWDQHTGGQTVTLPVPSLSTVPLFLRAGAIVARREFRSGRRSVQAALADPLGLLVLLSPGSGGSASGLVYLDDGHSRRSNDSLLVEFTYGDGALASRVIRQSGVGGGPVGGWLVESVVFVGIAAKPGGALVQQQQQQKPLPSRLHRRRRRKSRIEGEAAAAASSSTSAEVRYDARHRVAVVRRVRLPLGDASNKWTLRLLPPGGTGLSNERDEL